MNTSSDLYIKNVKKELGFLRNWFEGFAAAGGKPAQFADSLRKAELLLVEYMKYKDEQSTEPGEQPEKDSELFLFAKQHTFVPATMDTSTANTVVTHIPTSYNPVD